ncbi:hypothetical protein Q5O24_01470 [Eubacteriaceae bacterium ES3]|nr:hypothetical protein Q5O24_01470 [Eubacteriaceae bacterium ES3]
MKQGFLVRIGLVLVLLITGCSGSGSISSGVENELYNYYYQVDLGASKDQVDDLFESGTDSDFGYSTYLDPDTGYGVSVFYDDANQVNAKMLYIEEDAIWDIYQSAEVEEAQADQITVGMTYQEVVDLLGSDGLEVMETVDLENPDQVVKGYYWLNQDQSAITVSFSQNEGTVIMASFIAAENTEAE